MKKYTYEVSVWTLQDEFITILKRSNVDSLGQIEDGELTIKDDGTEELTFSIPMYIYNGQSRVVNPIWHSTMNGDIIANMRKIKVIFNKNTDVARCFEFLIIDTEESHSNDVLACTVKCEGLAFHELGKIGYKISLSSDAFYNEDYEWYAGTARYDEENPEPEPRATLQYWNNKFLTPYPEDGVLDPRTWYYVVNMDWGAYADGDNRDSSIVYEEAYTSSWQLNNGQLIPSGTISYKEKERLVDLEESNIYNITQELAETFGVFCRYEYVYDENYYIIGKVVHYYNNYFKEDEGYLDLTYPYSTSAITRHKDGTDITTKMFVRPVDSESTDSGWITIIDVPANKSGEDYILNFDYLYSIKAITDEQYAAIPEYEYHMAECNNHMRVLDNILLTLRNELPELEAKVITTTNSIREDQERITASDDLLNMLIYKDISSNTSLTVDEKNPYTGILLKSKDRAEEGTYYVKITDAGVLPETVRVFHTYNFGSHHLDDPMNGGIPEYDEFGNLVAMKGYQVEENDLKTVYLTYQYIPHLQYERVKNTWLNRLAKDEADLSDYTERLNTLRNKIDQYQQEYDTWYDQKEEYKTKFERMMGPALRESYWQPEDYKDCGDRHMDDMEITNVPLGPTDDYSRGESGYTLFMWDTERFEEEDKLTYNFSVNEEEHMYPYVELSDPNLLEFVKDHLDTVSFLWYDYNLETGESYEPRNIRAFTAGSQAQYGFVLSDGQIVPALILTGALDLSDISLANMASASHCPQLGVIHTNIPEGNETALTVTIEAACDPSTGQFINLAETNGALKTEANTQSIPQMFYPRIKIGSLAVRTNDEELSVMLNNDLLTNYADYYVLSRYTEHTIDEEVIPDFAYYVTLKPRTLLAHTYQDNNNITQIGGALSFRFTLSNADTAIYLDALPVLKENAYPRVSYDIDPSVVDTAFLYTIYNKLNRIVNINDTDLRLENVQGYISSITIDLDQPQNDQIEIKNYKTKFEDLFSSIVAQTEEMKKNSLSIEYAASAFTSTGGLSSTILQGALNSSSLTYSFNDDKLIIDEVNGLVAENDNGGVVSIRNNGIFTANEKDAAGDWIWNTAISPSGISANLLTAGQLDTSKINIYAGDRLRFQLNGDGLYAYKSFFSDQQLQQIAMTTSQQQISQQPYINTLNATGNIDPKQYVVHNAEGLFLTAKAGAYLLNDEGNAFTTLATDVDRVEISWNGLVLRNWQNDRVFFADPSTGDLTMQGEIYATGLHIADGTGNFPSFEDYLNEIAGITKVVDASLELQEIITNPELLATQANTDNNVVAWFFNGNPSVYTLPTSQWHDIDDTNNQPIDRIAWHVGDYYYNLTDSSVWQFVEADNNTYVWNKLDEDEYKEEILSFQVASLTSESYDNRIAAYYAPAVDATINVINQIPDTDNIIWAPGITEFEIGDYWVNTSQNNAVYRYDGMWVLIRDTTFDDFIAAIRDDNISYITEQDGDKTFSIWFYPISYDPYQMEWGSDAVRHIGDLWYQVTQSERVLKKFVLSEDEHTNQITFMWQNYTDNDLLLACQKLENTPYITDNVIHIFADTELIITGQDNSQNETLIPDASTVIAGEGDLWINLSRNNTMYQYKSVAKSSYQWQQISDNTAENIVLSCKKDNNDNSMQKRRVYYCTSAEGTNRLRQINALADGDLWYNLDNAAAVKIYQFVGSPQEGADYWHTDAIWWNEVTTYNLQRALANLMINVAISKDMCINIYTDQASNPSLELAYQTPSFIQGVIIGLSEGDVWINTSSNDAVYRYLNNYWSLYEEPVTTVYSTLPSNTIVRINTQYCLSESDEELVNNTMWTDVMPEYITGQYIWQRNAITRDTITIYEPSEIGQCIEVLTDHNIAITADAQVFLESLLFHGFFLESETDTQANVKEKTEKYITLTANLTNVQVGNWYYLQKDEENNDVWVPFNSQDPVLKVYGDSIYPIWINNVAHIKVVSLESDLYYDTITLYMRPIESRMMENEDTAYTFARDEEIVIPVDNYYRTLYTMNFTIPLTSYHGKNINGKEHNVPVGALMAGSGVPGKIICSMGTPSATEDILDLPLNILVQAPVDLSENKDGYIQFVATQPKIEVIKIHWRTLVSSSIAGGISITSNKPYIENINETIELTAHYYYNGEVLDNNEEVVYKWSAVPAFTHDELYDDNLQTETPLGAAIHTRSIILDSAATIGSRTCICTATYQSKTFTDFFIVQNKTSFRTIKIIKHTNSNYSDYYYFVAQVYNNSQEEITGQNVDNYIYVWTINELEIPLETISTAELRFINTLYLGNNIAENDNSDWKYKTVGYNKIIKVHKKFINARTILNCSMTKPDDSE